MDADEQSPPQEKRSNPYDYTGPGERLVEGDQPSEPADRSSLSDEDIDRIARQVNDESDRRRRTYRGIELTEHHAARRQKLEALAIESLVRRQTSVQSGAGKQDPPQTSLHHSDDFSHNDDYSSVRLHGQEHLLQGRTAEIIRILHKALQSGHPWVHRDRIATELNYDAELTNAGPFRVRDAFTTREQYKALVESTKKGRYRLRE